MTAYTTDIGIRRDTPRSRIDGRRPMPGTSTSDYSNMPLRARRSKASSRRRHPASRRRSEAGRRHDPELRRERRIQGYVAVGQEPTFKLAIAARSTRTRRTPTRCRIRSADRFRRRMRCATVRPPVRSRLCRCGRAIGTWVEFDGGRGSTVEEPLHGHGRLYMDAAESIHSFRRSARSFSPTTARVLRALRDAG